jgi:flagellar motility protein MotE (MotC chaperone)
MSTPKPLLIGFLTVILTAGFPAPSLSQDTKKPEAETRKADPNSGDGVQQYCSNIANFAADARIAWQMKRLGELEAQTKQRIAELEAKEVESKDWIDKRAELMKKAEDGVVAIYAKMQPEAAAAQMVVMEDATAAALLTKLNARVSSAILNEMEAGKAARLTELMSGAIAERKKS